MFPQEERALLQTVEDKLLPFSEAPLQLPEDIGRYGDRPSNVNTQLNAPQTAPFRLGLQLGLGEPGVVGVADGINAGGRHTQR